MYQSIIHVPCQLAEIVRKLKDKFSSLFILVLRSAKKCLDVSELKSLVHLILRDNRDASLLNSLQHHINALDRIESVEDLLDFLIRFHFIGYLNYTLLRKISDLTNDSELEKKFDKYEEEYEELHKSTYFQCLMEVFKSDCHLSPTTAVGLPEAIFRLDHRWTERTVYTWQKHFAHKFPWVDSAIVRRYSPNCILITYAILPSVLADVMRDLTNPAIIAELKDNGVTIVQLPQEKGIV